MATQSSVPYWNCCSGRQRMLWLTKDLRSYWKYWRRSFQRITNCPPGLEVEKIHACPNDCILYRGAYKDLGACPVCGALWYKIRRDDPCDVDGEHPRKRVLAKVMWYAHIIPRLKHLFRNKEHAKLIDTSPSYLPFQTILPLFWTLTCMIWMELTRTDTVFSRSAMVLFFVQKKKFLEWPENP